jgi:hypothetical protein
MNRKIFLSAMSIIATAALTSGVAFAQFTTTATATGNTFSTTNPQLLINTGSGAETSEPGFTETGLTPGASPVVHNFTLFNADTDTNATMTLTGQFNATAGDPSLEPNMDVRVTCDNGTDTTPLTISTWIAGGVTLGTLAPGATTNCTMQASIPGTDTTDANKSITFDAIFSASVGS